MGDTVKAKKQKKNWFKDLKAVFFFFFWFVFQKLFGQTVSRLLRKL